MSDTAWARHRAASSHQLPVQRPKSVLYERRTAKWRLVRADRTSKMYPSIDTVYDAAIRGEPLQEDDDDDDDEDSEEEGEETEDDDEQHGTTKPGSVSDAAWARQRGVSSHQLPAQRPEGVRYNRDTAKWRFYRPDGTSTQHCTIDAVYDAYIRGDDEQHRTTSKTKSGVSDTAWARQRVTSSYQLPVQRPKRVLYDKNSGKWRLVNLDRSSTMYPSIDAVYDAVVEPLQDDDDDDDETENYDDHHEEEEEEAYCITSDNGIESTIPSTSL